MNARLFKTALIAGLFLPWPVWGQNSVTAKLEKEIDLSAVQQKFQGVGADQRLARLKELSGEIPDLKNLSLDDADALAISLGNPELSTKDGVKVLNSYVDLAKRRNWGSYEPLHSQLAQVPARGTSFMVGVQPNDVDQAKVPTLEQFRILLTEVQKLKARVAELENKLMEGKK